MKTEMNFTWESQAQWHGLTTHKKLRKEAKEFLDSSFSTEQSEPLYVIKAHMDENGVVSSHGVCYGQPHHLQFIVESECDEEEVFLAEATSKEAVLQFIKMGKKRVPSENIFIFKLPLWDSQYFNTSSFHGGEHPLALKMYPYDEEKEEMQLEPIKVLGSVF